MSEPIESTEPRVSTVNDAVVMMGANLPNHTMSAKGFGKWVRLGTNTPTVFRTRQEAWRAVAWIMAFVERQDLPEERTEANENYGPDGLYEIFEAVFKEANVELAPVMLALMDVEEEDSES